MSTLKETCLHQRHIDLGAKMSPFGGFDMPIEYEGIVEEHNAVRQSAGIFDVSHMGEIRIEGDHAADFVNHIFTGDVRRLADGQIAYGMMTAPDGGTIDDLLVYRVSDKEFFLVINAANIDKDEQWIARALEESPYDMLEVTFESDYWSEIALQGPKAQDALEALLPQYPWSDLKFYNFVELDITVKDEDDHDVTLPVIVSRTGYTGEDGFEIYACDELIDYFWDALLMAGVVPCGLGCRDTLRFEAGLPLYGDELTAEISPVEAGLSMFVDLEKPDFIGKEALAKQKAEGVTKKVVGLEISGPAIARHGYEVLDATGTKVVGHITTGYRSITLGRNLSMALINAEYAKLGTELQVKVRRKTFPATVIKKRFYTPKYRK